MTTGQRLAAFVLGFALPALVWLGVISGGSFDPFGPAYGWQAYNHQALSLAAGKLDIPAEAISGEGLYLGGEVHMYYGLIPAVLRLPLMPFVDLRQVPVSNLIVWAMLVAGTAALQLAVLRIWQASGRDAPIDRVLVVVVSLILWFGSGSYLLVHNANLYHQPYAAAAMLASFYVAMLAGDLLVAGRPPAGSRLILYALVAGLAVYSRQTYAVGLYVATLGLLLPPVSAWRADRRGAALAAVRSAILPLLVMFVAGVGYLAIGYARFGRLTTGWTVREWGFGIIQPWSDRLETLADQQFSVVRIVPNIIFQLIGQGRWRNATIKALGGGTVETHGYGTIHYVLFAPLALLLAGLGGWLLWRLWRSHRDVAVPLLLAVLGLLVTALLQLSYGTMSYRYTAESWPLLTLLMLITLRHAETGRVAPRWRPAAMAAMVGLTAVSIAYTTLRRPAVWFDAPRLEGALVQPLPPKLAALATAPGSRDPTIEPIRIRVGDGDLTDIP
jgi:hypothetical protein